LRTPELFDLRDENDRVSIAIEPRGPEWHSTTGAPPPIVPLEGAVRWVRGPGLMTEHAVIVRFTYAERTLAPFVALERRLQRALEDAAVGEYDGNEIATDLSRGVIWMYGPDAEALFQAVRPVLAEASCLAHAEATLRFGMPTQGAPQRTERLRD